MAEKKTATPGKAMTKSETFAQLATATNLSKKQVGEVFDALGALIKKELGKKGPGVFTLPGLLKLTRKHKPATKAHRGINRFTKLEQDFPAKPAHSVVRARPLKSLKEMVK